MLACTPNQAEAVATAAREVRAKNAAWQSTLGRILFTNQVELRVARAYRADCPYHTVVYCAQRESLDPHVDKMWKTVQAQITCDKGELKWLDVLLTQHLKLFAMDVMCVLDE